MGRKSIRRLVDEALAAGRVTITPATRRPIRTVEKVSLVRFTLAPSTNNLYLNVRGRGRVKSPEYREWIKDNEKEARRLRSPDKYPVRVCYAICGKVNRSMDGFNREKAATDLIVANGVIEKDSLMCVTGGRWEYRPSDDEPHMLVWLEEIDA